MSRVGVMCWGLIRYEFDGFEQVGMDGVGLFSFVLQMDWFGLDWIGLMGLDWIDGIGMDCIGLDGIGLYWIGSLGFDLYWIGLH